MGAFLVIATAFERAVSFSSTSAAGTYISGFSPSPLSINPCQADSTGSAMAKTASWILLSFASWLLGKRWPR